MKKRSAVLLGVAGAWAAGWGVVSPAFDAEPASAAVTLAEPATAWTNKFHRIPRNGVTPGWGWIAGDGTYSAMLPDSTPNNTADNTMVWSFGDSAAGRLRTDGTRYETPAGWLYNSMVTTKRQTGDALFQFHSTGTRQAYGDKIPSKVTNTFYWPAAVAVEGSELKVFVRHIRKDAPTTPGGSPKLVALGTRIARFNATSLAPIGDVDATPYLPTGMAGLQWGSAVTKVGDWWYVYGENHEDDTDDDGGRDFDDAFRRSTYIARTKSLVPATTSNVGVWEFYTSGGWKVAPSTSTPLKKLSLAGGGNMQYGVYSMKPVSTTAGTKYVFLTISQAAPGGKLESFVSNSPEGGLGSAKAVASLPEFKLNEVSTYIPVVHNITDANGRHLVSYNVNRTGGSAARQDEYRPRFLWVDLNKIAATG